MVEVEDDKRDHKVESRCVPRGAWRLARISVLYCIGFEAARDVALYPCVICGLEGGWEELLWWDTVMEAKGRGKGNNEMPDRSIYMGMSSQN